MLKKKVLFNRLLEAMNYQSQKRVLVKGGIYVRLFCRDKYTR